MSEICGCAYPAKCGYLSSWNKECQDAYNYNNTPIQLHCSLQCPVECNQISFEFNRADVEWDISQSDLNKYKPNISAKFNITEMSDERIAKRMTRLNIYFGKLQTTEISQSPSMTSTNLVGNVGGLLGN